MFSVLAAAVLATGCGPSVTEQNQKAAAAHREKVKAELQNDPPMDVVGITLGAPLTVPKCKGSGYDKSHNVVETCWRRSEFSTAKGPLRDSDSVEVLVVEEKLPVGVYYLDDVSIKDGVVTSLQLRTLGDIYQEDLYRMVVAKWGEPLEGNVTKLQNGFGAQYASIDAQWSFSKLQIIFMGRTGTDSGLIWFRLPPKPDPNAPKSARSL